MPLLPPTVHTPPSTTPPSAPLAVFTAPVAGAAGEPPTVHAPPSTSPPSAPLAVFVKPMLGTIERPPIISNDFLGGETTPPPAIYLEPYPNTVFPHEFWFESSILIDDPLTFYGFVNGRPAYSQNGTLPTESPGGITQTVLRWEDEAMPATTYWDGPGWYFNSPNSFLSRSNTFLPTKAKNWEPSPFVGFSVTPDTAMRSSISSPPAILPAPAAPSAASVPPGVHTAPNTSGVSAPPTIFTP